MIWKTILVRSFQTNSTKFHEEKPKFAPLAVAYSARFVCLYGLQIIPLLGLFLMLRHERWLTERHKVQLAVIGATSYLMDNPFKSRMNEARSTREKLCDF